MKTRDFISSVAMDMREDSPIRDSNCSSVVVRDGVLYSYGLHYPLMYKVNGLIVVNAAGYSATTAKHISYAARHADITVFDSKIAHTKEAIVAHLSERYNAKLNEYNALKRKNTQKALQLLADIGRIRSHVEAMRS